MKSTDDEIDVIEVGRDRLMDIAGMPWTEAVTKAESMTAQLRRVRYWNFIDKPAEGSAWLRQHDGRAFLYRQNF